MSRSIVLSDIIQFVVATTYEHMTYFQCLPAQRSECMYLNLVSLTPFSHHGLSHHAPRCLLQKMKNGSRQLHPAHRVRRVSAVKCEPSLVMLERQLDLIEREEMD